MITVVDVGATKTLVAQFGANGTAPVHEVRFKTPHDQEAFLDVLHHHLQQFTDVSVLSVGVPGVVNRDGVVERCGVLPWRAFPLRQRLARTYRCPIYIENDAKLAGLAEVNSVTPTPALGIYITVSTGIGSGIIVDGKLLDAFRGSEVGHMVFLHEGKWEPWQEIASGSTIYEHFHKLAKDLTLKTDWQWIADQLTLGFLALIPAFQPQVIVFGGSVGEYFEKYGPLLNEQLRHRLPEFIPMPLLKEAIHPTEAVLYGCYYHATHQQTR